MSKAAQNAERGPTRDSRRQRTGSATKQRSQATGARPRRKAAVALLTDLAEASRAEDMVASLLTRVRERLAVTVICARAKGLGFDRLAQASLRAVHGQTITVAEREREAARFRKLVQRRRRDTSHDFRSREFERDAPSAARLERKEKDKMERLLKRRTIEETFAVEDTDRELAADDREDEIDGADEDDEDNEPSRAARPRR